jgi:hypothetical protein
MGAGEKGRATEKQQGQNFFHKVFAPNLRNVKERRPVYRFHQALM